MITLMTYAGPAEEGARVTRTGGLPLVTGEFEWPECASCGGPMQFVVQLLLDDLGRYAGQGAESGRGVLAAWMCQNDPGLCDDWDPASGGNAAVLFPGDAALAPARPPEGSATTLAEVSAVAYHRAEAAGYFDATAGWTKATGRGPREVLGALGGSPEWIQGDETPDCPGCGEPMGFVAQLEEGHDHETAANFGGGGGAFVFACEGCGRAAFLWQTG